MAIPFAPIALAAARYGAVAGLAYLAARHARPRPVDPTAQAALDKVPLGVDLGHAPGQLNAMARLRKTLRPLAQGPAMEFDLSAIARLTVRRIA